MKTQSNAAARFIAIVSLDELQVQAKSTRTKILRRICDAGKRGITVDELRLKTRLPRSTVMSNVTKLVGGESPRIAKKAPRNTH